MANPRYAAGDGFPIQHQVDRFPDADIVERLAFMVEGDDVGYQLWNRIDGLGHGFPDPVDLLVGKAVLEVQLSGAETLHGHAIIIGGIEHHLLQGHIGGVVKKRIFFHQDIFVGNPLLQHERTVADIGARLRPFPGP